MTRDTRKKMLLSVLRKDRRIRRDIETIFATVDHWNALHPEAKPVPYPAGRERLLAAVDQSIVLIRDMLAGRRPLFGLLPSLPLPLLPADDPP